MQHAVSAHIARLLLFTLLALAPQSAQAEPQHGIAMYGTPALPPDFVSLPQANPDAPKGGTITFAAPGSFDSLNPFVTAGTPPEGVAPLTFETLLARNQDEPFTLYGLLAESVETDAGRTYVEFTLREAARFSDGSPVTVEDVLWSFETLGTLGNPRYLTAWSKVASAEATGPRTVRFTFNVEDRELPLILGLRPVLRKADFEGKTFGDPGLAILTGSGPYIIDKVDPGRSILYRRNPDWWGKDLPFNRGQWNFETIRYEYFANTVALFEAVRAGEITAFREDNLARWASRYDFPAVTSGAAVKLEVPHSRPSGIIGLVMNTRKPQFADWRVREALIQAFNLPYVNQTITGGAAPRITSYFGNSPLGMTPGTPAEGQVLSLLQPFAATLPPGAIEGYALPEGDAARPLPRRALREATRLLEEAGWSVDQGGILRDAQGKAFQIEILLTVGQDEVASITAIYAEALKALGIQAQVTLLDAAQLKARTDAFDFDMTYILRTLSLSPGNEQSLYWGSEAAGIEGSRNWMGARDPAIDAMIAALLAAQDEAGFTAAVQGLDRALMAGRYVVPFWFADRNLILHDRRLKHPDAVPLYGDWAMSYLPALWWYEE